MSLNIPRKSKRAAQLDLVRGLSGRPSVGESVHPDEEAKIIVEEETLSRHLEGVEQENSNSMEVPTQQEQNVSIKEEEEADAERQQEYCVGQEEIHVGDNSDVVCINRGVKGTQLHSDIDMERFLKDLTVSLMLI